jgi:hypothetical protein
MITLNDSTLPSPHTFAVVELFGVNSPVVWYHYATINDANTMAEQARRAHPDRLFHVLMVPEVIEHA